MQCCLLNKLKTVATFIRNPLLISVKYVYLQRVFHGIRFKVNEGRAVVMTALLFCLFPI
jgi:hypothetical protein